MQKYQFDYAAGRSQMYDVKSRKQKAYRIVKTLKAHKKLTNLKDLTLLDVGSSTGIMDSILSKYFKKVIGVDIDKSAVAYAKKKFKKNNLLFKVADAMQLNFPDKSFDVVICAHVYEHVPNTNKLFKEIYRVLRKDGICYLAAQNKLFPWEPHHNLPLLSWFPKRMADIYINIFSSKKEYYEHPMTWWELYKSTKMFEIDDYTSKILKNPEIYGYTDVLKKGTFKALIASIFSPFAKYTFPTFFWILNKK